MEERLKELIGVEGVFLFTAGAGSFETTVLAVEAGYLTCHVEVYKLGDEEQVEGPDLFERVYRIDLIEGFDVPLQPLEEILAEEERNNQVTRLNKILKY